MSNWDFNQINAHHIYDPYIVFHFVVLQLGIIFIFRFSDSLQQLLESMSRCTPWFVRCIKPNNDKTPMRFDMPVVLQQLRYLGLLDTIHIRQAGYPIRLKFQQFVDQYRYLIPGILPRGAPYRDLCRAILERMPPTGTGK